MTITASPVAIDSVVYSKLNIIVGLYASKLQPIQARQFQMLLNTHLCRLLSYNGE